MQRWRPNALKIGVARLRSSNVKIVMVVSALMLSKTCVGLLTSRFIVASSFFFRYSPLATKIEIMLPLARLKKRAARVRTLNKRRAASDVSLRAQRRMTNDG